jgi:hypothetical protein
MAKVKRMVGVDDPVFRNVSSKTTLPGTIALGSRASLGRFSVMRDTGAGAFEASPGMAMDDATGAREVSNDLLRQLDDDDLNNVRLAARAYVRGDSKLVTSYSPLFSRAIGTITIPVWPMLSVTVASGSVLHFGPGVHALVAYQVTIEDGGRIVSQGHLTVNCTRFRKPGRVRPGLVVGGSLTTEFRPIFSE